MPKIADKPPVYCASCHRQNVELRHVDFEAYYDGPVINGDIKVSIDDLIICEECMRAGAELLGYIKDDESRDLILEYIDQVDKMDKQITQLEQEKRDLIFTVEHVTKHPPKPTSRPKVARYAIPDITELSEVTD